MGERKLLFLMNAEQAKAFARLVEAANRGDGDAACQLGDMYREGLGGLRYSPKAAHRWYARSAMAGRRQRAEQPGRLLRARAGLRAVLSQGREVVPAVGGAEAGHRVHESRLLLLARPWGAGGQGGGAAAVPAGGGAG